MRKEARTVQESKGRNRLCIMGSMRLVYRLEMPVLYLNWIQPLWRVPYLTTQILYLYSFIYGLECCASHLPILFLAAILNDSCNCSNLNANLFECSLLEYLQGERGKRGRKGGKGLKRRRVTVFRIKSLTAYVVRDYHASIRWWFPTLHHILKKWAKELLKPKSLTRFINIKHHKHKEFASTETWIHTFSYGGVIGCH